ncbi:MAG: SURF1 family protein [Propioniciclava sp.]|uniref:SURF1 family cytochrome oxidase biogenesis protein n=1 Tax=Propioniciclava sp. TaxID=2038686 RepID=UPI0039E6D9EC
MNKKLLLRWGLLVVFVVVLGGTFVSLGRWQLDRLDQRRDRNEIAAVHENAPVRPFDEVFTGPIADADQWQRVEVRGTFLADRQLQARHRSFGEATGWELLTPLVTGSGKTVIVSRGFIERPASQDYPSVYPEPPAGEVTVIGYVRRNEQGNANAITPQQQMIRLIDSRAIGAWLGRDVVDGYLNLISVTPPQTEGLTPITPPPPTEGPHLSYAFQWFTFALIAGAGLFILIRNDLRDRKKAAAKAAARAADAGSSAASGAPGTSGTDAD